MDVEFLGLNETKCENVLQGAVNVEGFPSNVKFFRGLFQFPVIPQTPRSV